MKAVAKIATIIGMVGSVIGGIALFAAELAGAGIVVIVLGCLFSWIGSLALYGFGELIEQVEKISYNTEKPPVSLVKNVEQEKTVKHIVAQSSKKTCPCCSHEVAQSDTVCKHCGQKLV